MHVIKDILIRKFIETNDFRFVHDDKDVNHGTDKVGYFFLSIEKELRDKHNIIKRVEELKKIWSNIRKRFVQIYLKKARFEKISSTEKEFYNSFMFLNDFIKHKNCDTYHTINHKAILNKQYDLLMGIQDIVENADENIHEIELEDEFPDIRGIFELSTNDYKADDQNVENIEFLEEYRDIIEKQLEKEKIDKGKDNTNVLATLDKRIAAEFTLSDTRKIDEMGTFVNTNVICDEVIKVAEEKVNNNASVLTNEKLLGFPVLEKRNAAESTLSGIKARNEMHSFIDASVIYEDVAKVLNVIVNNEKNSAFIASFCEKHL